MLKRILFSYLCLTCCFSFTKAQVVFNEIQSSNISGILDEDNEYSDWVELYNSYDHDVDLEGYYLKDNKIDSSKWVFPDITIPSKSYLLVFASGKDRNVVNSKFHTIIKKGENWKYFVPASEMPVDWRSTGFNDSSWASGPSGFGFGDDDDATVLNNIQTVLIRKEFYIEDVSSITQMLLHIDYDDGFIAFINGMPVAMGGITSFSEDYSVIEAENHEAVIYAGGIPDQINLTDKIPVLRNGKNVIAIQGHNTSNTSSDFSLIPFLTLSSKDYTTNDAISFINITNGNLHANFKISKEGESIYLFNPTSELIDSTKSIALEDDISYGRYKDGDKAWFYFEQPTPGSENTNPIESISHDSVVFSANAGFYNQPFELILHSSSNKGEIRYTTDGSVPTIQSQIFTEKILISATTVLRAAIFNDSNSKNPVTTKTFMFNNSNGLPIVSISTDPKNFFDWNEGILELEPNAEDANPNFGANFWMDWEKPINFEFFDKEGVPQVNQGAGIKVSGNWSRANAQKSLAVYARKSYGKGAFKYKFFNDRVNDSFESLTLRNSGNDWSYTMMRDGLFSEMAKEMNMERLAYQPSVVYLNGEYWGILNIRERPNEHYFFENFDVDQDDLNLIEFNTNENLVYGKADDYLAMRDFFNSNSLLDENSYKQVTEMMDIGCFIDYELLEIFIDNGDWPGNNNKFWKSNDPYSKWRWLIFDADFGFNLYRSNGNTMVFATTPDGGGWPNPPFSTLFLRKLLENEEFRNQFVNRFSDCLNTNLFSISINAKIDSIQNILEPEIQNHLTRWSLSYLNWESQVERLKSYAIGRKNDMRDYMRDYFNFKLDYVITLSVSDDYAGKIKINTIIPGTYPFKGNYFGEVPITLKAIPNPGYRFVRWEKGSSSTEISVKVNLTSDMKFHAVFEPVSETDYQIVINEINYKSSDESDAGDWIEIYNNGDQTVDMNGWVIQDDDISGRFVFPAGKLLYPQEYLVITGNSTKFHSVYPTVADTVGEFIFGLNSSGDIVYLYDDEGNLIDKVSFGVQSPWPVNPNGTGATLELKAPSLNNEQAGNWDAGKPGGTPGNRNSVALTAELVADAGYQASCFPTCFTDYTTLRFYSRGEGSYSVKIIDLQGRVLEKHEGTMLSHGLNFLDLFKESDRFSGGIYFVNIQSEIGVQTIKVIKQ